MSGPPLTDRLRGWIKRPLSIDVRRRSKVGRDRASTPEPDPVTIETKDRSAEIDVCDALELLGESSRDERPATPVSEVNDLLQYEGEAFVECCYLTLLDRPADAAGRTQFRQALDQGRSKLDIAMSIASSPEGRAAGRYLRDLRAAFVREKIAQLLLATSPLGAGELSSLEPLMAALVNEPPLPAAPRIETQEPANTIAAAIAEPAATKIVWMKQATVRDMGPRTAKNRYASRAPTELWMDLTCLLTSDDELRPHRIIQWSLVDSLSQAGCRFCIRADNGFAEVGLSALKPMFRKLPADECVETEMERRLTSAITQSVRVNIPDAAELFYPFASNAIVFAVAGRRLDRPALYTALKQRLPNLCLSFLVLDPWPAIPKTAHSYRRADRHSQEHTLRWLAEHCDFLIFDSEFAREQVSTLQRSRGWWSPPSVSIQLSAPCVCEESDIAESVPLPERLLDAQPFMLTAGPIAPFTNHDVLYRAYLLALEMTRGQLPAWVVCGPVCEGASNLAEMLDHDPRLKGKLFRLDLGEPQLATLYDTCAFAVLPSLYDGADLAIRTSIGRGALTLAADTLPLRAAGGHAATYVAASDVRAWAESFVRMAENGRDTEQAPQFHQRHSETSWVAVAVELKRTLTAAQRRNRLQKPIVDAPRAESTKPTIWMDLTLTFLEWSGHVTGIIRAELALAHYLKKLAPDTCFFAYVRRSEGYFFKIEDEHLDWLFNANDLSSDYSEFQARWREREARSEFRDPFRKDGVPDPFHAAYLPRFPDETVVFFAAIDQDGTGTLHRTRFALEMILSGARVMLSQLIYDLTPILIPQVHAKWTSTGYAPFIKFVSDQFDHLIFGGRTAQRDCRLIQQQNGWGSPPSDFLEFGSDLSLTGDESTPPDPSPSGASRPHKLPQRSQSADDRLARLGIVSDFVMSVGTIEPRKNHALLYRAYLHILEQGSVASPLQMVFVGKKGWNVDDLMREIEDDERLRRKLLIISPADDDLELLYRRCCFTLLPSFYEGWSLTLPESLNYGKFCICSDVDPLREVGQDLVEYVHPLDTLRWADRIAHYANSAADRAAREARIRLEWKARSWQSSTEMLLRTLHGAYDRQFSAMPASSASSATGRC